VGSESDRRVQIQNFGTTAERGSRSYALCSRNTWLAVFSADRRVVHVVKIHQLKSMFPCPEKGIICSQVLPLFKQGTQQQRDCPKFSRRRIYTLQGGTNSRVITQQGVDVINVSYACIKYKETFTKSAACGRISSRRVHKKTPAIFTKVASRPGYSLSAEPCSPTYQYYIP
jgi:hypothetical protein